MHSGSTESNQAYSPLREPFQSVLLSYPFSRFVQCCLAFIFLSLWSHKPSNIQIRGLKKQALNYVNGLYFIMLARFMAFFGFLSRCRTTELWRTEVNTCDP